MCPTATGMLGVSTYAFPPCTMRRAWLHMCASASAMPSQALIHTFIVIFIPLNARPLMSNTRYISWSESLTMMPGYSPSGTAIEYPSPISRQPSFCPSDGGRRDSSIGFVSAMESKGQWSSIGSESKSPLAQFGFFKNLADKKTTRGSYIIWELLATG